MAMMRQICHVLVLSGTTSAVDAWAQPGVASAQPLRARSSATLLAARRAGTCNLDKSRDMPILREEARHGDASESFDNDVSRRGFLRRVTAAFGAAAAAGVASPRASFAGEGRSVADVKKGIEADFLSR